jgi:hypothetical protein
VYIDAFFSVMPPDFPAVPHYFNDGYVGESPSKHVIHIIIITEITSLIAN